MGRVQTDLMKKIDRTGNITCGYILWTTVSNDPDCKISTSLYSEFVVWILIVTVPLELLKLLPSLLTLDELLFYSES